jgi:hypothetical protein
MLAIINGNINNNYSNCYDDIVKTYVLAVSIFIAGLFSGIFWYNSAVGRLSTALYLFGLLAAAIAFVIFGKRLILIFIFLILI